MTNEEKQLPEVIYLTKEIDGEICWCEDQIQLADTKYIRSDVLIERIKGMRENDLAGIGPKLTNYYQGFNSAIDQVLAALTEKDTP